MANPLNNRNILFVGIARKNFNDALIIASYAYHTETNIDIVRQVLEDPKAYIEPGKHYVFSVGGAMQWHIISDDAGLIYILIAALNYPQRQSLQLLDELKVNFSEKCDHLKALNSKERALDDVCKSMLVSLCRKYDNLVQIDKIADLSAKVDSVKLVMQENIDIALQNCVKIESLEEAAEQLSAQAGAFSRNATALKRKVCWKTMQFKIIAVVLCLFLLGLIIGLSYYFYKQYKG